MKLTITNPEGERLDYEGSPEGFWRLIDTANALRAGPFIAEPSHELDVLMAAAKEEMDET